MTREEAIIRCAELPQYIPGPCPDCGAVTVKDASAACRPMQYPCGEWYCAIDEEAPETDGLIHVINPEWCELDGYLWGWHAFDEGLTQTPPAWRGDPERNPS